MQSPGLGWNIDDEGKLSEFMITCHFLVSTLPINNWGHARGFGYLCVR